MNPRGVVQRMILEPLPRCLYLRRNEKVLLGDQWEWTTDKHDAYVFAEFERAEAAAERIRKRGERLVFPVVFGEDAEQERTQAQPPRLEAPRRRPAKDEQWHRKRLQRHREMMERMHLD
jgi:hypothetical protein